MARPRTTRATEATMADLRGEFLDRCRAKNLSPRTLEWYEDRTRRFSDWCLERGILPARDLTTDDLEDFVLSLQAGPYRPQTVRGFAQIAKWQPRESEDHRANDPKAAGSARGVRRPAARRSSWNVSGVTPAAPTAGIQTRGRKLS